MVWRTMNTTPRKVPLGEAARLFGTSASTVRRWIKAGILSGEPVPRPQGVKWIVVIPDGVLEAASANIEAPSKFATKSANEATRRSEAERSEGIVSTVVAPLMGTIAHQLSQLASQQATIARLTVEVTALRGLREKQNAILALLLRED